MSAGRLLAEASVEELLQVNGQKLMRVALLAYSVSTPNCRHRLNNWERISFFLFANLVDKLAVPAKVATRLSAGVHFLEHHIVEGHSVGKALHHCVEEAGVPVIHHWVSNSLGYR